MCIYTVYTQYITFISSIVMYLNVHNISYHIVILCFVFSGGSPTCRTTYEGTPGGLRSDLKGSVTSAHLCSSCVIQIHTVYLILILILYCTYIIYMCISACIYVRTIHYCRTINSTTTEHRLFVAKLCFFSHSLLV